MNHYLLTIILHLSCLAFTFAQAPTVSSRSCEPTPTKAYNDADKKHMEAAANYFCNYTAPSRVTVPTDMFPIKQTIRALPNTEDGDQTGPYTETDEVDDVYELTIELDAGCQKKAFSAQEPEPGVFCKNVTIDAWKSCEFHIRRTPSMSLLTTLFR